MGLAIARPLHEAFNFHVAIGSDDALFSQVGPLKLNISVNTYREGGSSLPIKDPGDVDFENVTLSRGKSTSKLFYNWANDVVNATIGTTNGLVVLPQQYVKTVTIYQRDRTRKTINKYYLYDAFPVECVAGDWDNSKDEVVIERVVLTYKYFVLVDA